jgi:hypothetical protein
MVKRLGGRNKLFLTSHFPAKQIGTPSLSSPVLGLPPFFA